METPTKRWLRGVLPLFAWFLNRQWMCKRGVGSAAYSRHVNGFATQWNMHRAESKLEKRHQTGGKKTIRHLYLVGRREHQAQPGAWKHPKKAHIRKRLFCQWDSLSCEYTCQLCKHMNKSRPEQFNKLNPVASSFSSPKRNNPFLWFQSANQLAESPKARGEIQSLLNTSSVKPI